MATDKVTPGRSKSRVPTPKKTSPKTAKPAATVSNGPEPVSEAKSPPKAGKKAPRDKDAPFNAETAQVLRDADAGKNLLEYPSLEAMFEDLGI